MRRSWKLGEVAGIGIYIHSTFWLLILFILFINWSHGHDLATTLSGVGFVLVIFGCIILHELGHALMALRFGIRTQDITLLPIGGLARLVRSPETPMQELWVALAGPAVNVAIALLLYGGLLAAGQSVSLTGFRWYGGGFLGQLMMVNVWLVAFNMIPAFPMDGGRVLRALLATRLEFARATRIAARVGQGIACIFGIVGLFTDPFLLFIGVFVWMGAGQEASTTHVQASVGDIPVQHVMLRDFRTLRPDDTLGQAVEHALGGWQEDFPVTFGDHVLGLLTREDMTQALAHGGAETRVRDAMRRDIPAPDLHQSLRQVLPIFKQYRCRSVPVQHEGRLVGLLTMNKVGEFLTIQSALREASRKAQKGSANQALNPPSNTVI